MLTFHTCLEGRGHPGVYGGVVSQISTIRPMCGSAILKYVETKCKLQTGVKRHKSSRVDVDIDQMLYLGTAGYRLGKGHHPPLLHFRKIQILHVYNTKRSQCTNCTLHICVMHLKGTSCIWQGTFGYHAWHWDPTLYFITAERCWELSDVGFSCLKFSNSPGGRFEKVQVTDISDWREL